MMIEKKEIELWDLHNKNVYIKVENFILNQIFTKFEENKLKFKIKNIWHYKNGAYFIPLDLIIKILDLFPLEEKINFKKLIELNLNELRYGYGKAKSIKNPKLPIRFSPQLARICGHLIGDGGIELTNGGYIVHYTNKNPFLIEQFKDDVINTFGEVEPYIYNYKNRNLKTIKFPSITGVILMELFNFIINNNKKTPNLILESNKESKHLFLQALFDDEGCVSSNRIIIEMSNEEIIRMVKNLLSVSFLIQSNKISEKKHKNYKNSYRLEIHGRNDIILFSKEIGFSHTEKKDKLNFYIKEYENKRVHFKKGELKYLIMNIFKKTNNLNIYKIAEILNIQPKRAFRRQLHILEKNNILQVVKGADRIKIYSL